MSKLVLIFVCMTISATLGRLFSVKSDARSNCGIKEYPYFAGIYDTKPENVVCGASILSPWWILSGGDCCSLTAEGHGAVTGIQFIGGNFDQKVPFEEIYRYENVSRRKTQETAPFDICIFKLKTKLKLTNRTSLIQIADRVMYIPNAMLIGYTHGPPKTIQQLFCTKMEILSQDKCLDKAPMIAEHGYCLRDLVDGPVCQGDEGSPVITAAIQICIFANRRDQQSCTDNKIQVCIRLDEEIRKFYRDKNIATLTRAVDGLGILDAAPPNLKIDTFLVLMPILINTVLYN